MKRGRLLRSAGARVGATLLVMLAVVALLGMWVTPYDPMWLDFDAPLSPPSAKHWFGTDQFGRDLLSRLMLAASITTAISLAISMFAVFIGAAVGAFAGYFGGWIDRTCALWMNALLAFPGILLALAILSVVGPSAVGVILALGVAYIPAVYRVVRAVTLSIREKDYVAASRVMGNSQLYTVFRHVLPNCVSSLTVMATALFGMTLLAESALSFLGLGVRPPLPTWGSMLADGRQFMTIAPWLGIFPGLAIWLTLIGVNLLGDAVRDRFDPRMELP